MPALIDGNNLLHAARAMDGRAKELDREQLCAILTEWARRRRQAATIVFDGAEPQGLLASQLLGSRRGLRVLFSGRGVSADDRIADLLADDTATRDITVVSADREVRLSARRCGARSVRSDDFWRGLRADEARWRTARAAEPREKRGGLAGDALELWLKEFSIPTDASFSDAEFQRILLDDERAKAGGAGTAGGESQTGAGGSSGSADRGGAGEAPSATGRGTSKSSGGDSADDKRTDRRGMAQGAASAPPKSAGKNPPAESQPPIVIDHTPRGRVEDFGPDGDALLAAAERMVTGSPDEWRIGTPEDALDAMQVATPGVKPLDGNSKDKRSASGQTTSPQRWDDASDSAGATRPASGDAPPTTAKTSLTTPPSSDGDLIPDDWEKALGNWPPTGTTPLDKKDRKNRRKS